MAPPRISGNLYNCSLNCALPHILEGIKQIALQGDDSAIAYRGAYELLKTKFEECYGLPISWHGFNLLLSGFSFNEIEVIMAPVIRLFVAEKCDSQERENVRDIISYKGQGIAPEIIEAMREAELDIPLNSPGRYLPLQNREANNYFYKHFGLYMRVHEFVEGSNPEEYRPEIAQTELIPIDVYLKDGHFELQKHLDAPHLDYPNTVIANLVETITSDQSAQTTNRVLANLVTFISTTVSQEIPTLSAHLPICPEDDIANPEQFKRHHDSEDANSSRIRQGLQAAQSQEIVHESSPKSISKHDFNAILAEYQTTYLFVNFLMRLFTFGYWGHESNTIKALKELSHNDSITNDMVTQVLSQDNNDSQQSRRLSFWRDGSQAQFNSGTDIVLRQLKAPLQ